VNRFLVAALLALILPAAAARADDVFLQRAKDKPSHQGTVKQESPAVVTLARDKGSLEIPAEQIRDIVYDIEPVVVRVNKYRPALKAEHDAEAAASPQARAKLYQEAVRLYEETLQGLKEGQPFARRHLEFKLALARWRLAEKAADPKALSKAFAGLAEFRGKNADGWQIGMCLQLLARWHLERKEWGKAESLLWELAKSAVALDLRQQAEVAALDLLARQGKHADAEVKLRALIAKHAKGSPPNQAARIGLVECLGYAKKLDEAHTVAEEVLNETKDKQLRARAYNALGVCYVINEKWSEASWEFLWVDLIYNQDRAEHARALYYLAKVFEELGEGDRARDYRSALQAGAYAGTLHQRWAEEQ
jgi:hypothetical protein